MNKNTIGDIHDNGSVNVIQGVGNIYNYGIKASEKTIYDEGHKPKINKPKLIHRLFSTLRIVLFFWHTAQVFWHTAQVFYKESGIGDIINFAIEFISQFSV